MNKKIYLTKPYDGTENFSDEEAKFIHTMNLKTPETSFISVSAGLNKAYERIPDGLPQYFHINGVDMEYIYPLEEKMLCLSPIDFSIPVLQPFRYTKFMKSLLKFDKIIFPDVHTLKHIIKENELTEIMRENRIIYGLRTFYSLDSKGEEKPFMEYSQNHERKHTKHYELSNKLIRAVTSGDFSELKYRGKI